MQIITLERRHRDATFFLEKTESMVRQMRRNHLAEDRRKRDPQCLCPRCTLMHAYTGLSQLALL